MLPNESSETHLTADQAAEYADGRSLGAGREAIERHLAHCDGCRKEVIEIRRLMQPVFTRQRRVIAWLGGSAALAAGLVLFLVNPDIMRTERPMLHRGESGALTEVRLIAPSASAANGEVRVFVWATQPRARRYELTVMDSVGATVWNYLTTDTSGVMPRTVSLIPGQRYFWKVNAETGWARSVSSRVGEFRVPVR